MTAELASPRRIRPSYAGLIDGKFLRCSDGSVPSEEQHRQHDAFRAFILAEEYPCLGGKAAITSGTYRLGNYGALDSSATVRELARDLGAFVADATLTGDFRTFAAVFARCSYDERGFERAVWTQLRGLAAIDRDTSAWDPSVSDDPEDPRFSFSFGGTALFVIGLHPHASRTARRFAWPALVFNPHRQFQALRDRGSWNRFTSAVRRRDIALQGSQNPNLADNGSASEARQYSGRAVEPDWRCPFSR